MLLGVNIDHVATLRNARGGVEPSVEKAAEIAENNGATSITTHLRGRCLCTFSIIKNTSKS